MIDKSALDEIQELADKYYSLLEEIDNWSINNLYPELKKVNSVREVLDTYRPIYTAIAGKDERGERTVMRSLPGGMPTELAFKIESVKFQQNNQKTNN